MNGLHAQAQILKDELGINLSRAFELLAKSHGFKTPNELTAQSQELNTVQLNIAQQETQSPVKTTYDAKLSLSPVKLLELESAQSTDPETIAKNLDAAARQLKQLAKNYRDQSTETLKAAMPKKLWLSALRDVKLNEGSFVWKEVSSEGLEVKFKAKMGTVVVGSGLPTTAGPVTVGMLFSTQGNLLDVKCVLEKDGSHGGEHRGLTEQLHAKIRSAEPRSIKIVPFYDIQAPNLEPIAFGLSLKPAGSRKEEFLRIRGSTSPFKTKAEAELFVETVRAKDA